jgi:hypothetical protein
MDSPLERFENDAAALASTYPPKLHHPNKELVYSIAVPAGSSLAGSVGYSRWPPMELPGSVDLSRAADRVTSIKGHYNYLPSVGAAGEVGHRDSPAMEWHVNFADAHLFVAYGSGLFAQDEMQAAEHPILGSLREALLAVGAKALTQEGGRPTPVLVTGAERRVRIATNADAAADRPYGLYGKAFARAEPSVVATATTRIEPPTLTNFLAMAAPAGGFGPYDQSEIRLILETAYTGFRAVALETARLHGDGATAVVHTGYWGCGAFGGNRVLMSLLQAVSAAMAGVDQLAFHTGPPGGDGPLNDAGDLLGGELAATSPVETDGLIDRIAAMGFQWGVSDGN